MKLFRYLKRKQKILSKKKGKIDLNDSLKTFYGKHRSGWLYALKSLEPLHNSKGTLFDSFIEKTFNWNPDGIKAHQRPWIGVIHVPPNIPDWFQGEQSNDSIFKTREFQESLPFCKGLFTLSKYHKKSLEQKLDVPINDLFFATEEPEVKWEWNKFQANKKKKVLQIGWWLRKLHTIYQLDANSYEKIFVKIKYADVDGMIKKERRFLKDRIEFDEKMYDSVTEYDFLSDNKYDKVLSENIIITNLYDSSANNLISECIVRNTPILVNPLPAVVEYLGKDYPFYFNSLEEASEKLENNDLIFKTHIYMKNEINKEKFTSEYFRKTFEKSSIYKSL